MMAQDTTFAVTDFRLTLLGSFGGSLRGWIELLGAGQSVGFIYLMEGTLPQDSLGGNGTYVVMHQPVELLESLLATLRTERAIQVRFSDGSIPPAAFLETGAMSTGTLTPPARILSNFKLPPASGRGTWDPLQNPPTFAASTMLLLTDGGVMCQEYNSRNWFRLSPDARGDYRRGAWSPLAPMNNSRLYYVSAVLADGRVLVSGGEFSDAGGDTAATEIYDPVADKWESIAGPTGWTEVGDAASCVLADGRMIIGALSTPDTAIFDPTDNTWSAGPKMAVRSNEETWTLMPDGCVVTASCAGHPNAEKYVPSDNAWVSAGTLPVELVEAASIEIGPAVLLPDGRVFAVGATGHTAFYRSGAKPTDPGTWGAGPDFPLDGQGQQLGAKDAPGCLLPNGNVLCAVGPVNGVEKDYLTPTYMFELSSGDKLVRVDDPPNVTQAPFEGRMLLLPTGQVLFAASTQEIYVYTPTGQALDAWRPTVTQVPTDLQRGQTHSLRGTQLNGLSQAVGYGDDAAAATNYPLVRLRHVTSGNVRYCRTHGHSSMGVATGATPQATHFDVPADTEPGDAFLSVIANGIASAEVKVAVS